MNLFTKEQHTTMAVTLDALLNVINSGTLTTMEEIKAFLIEMRDSHTADALRDETRQ